MCKRCPKENAEDRSSASRSHDTAGPRFAGRSTTGSGGGRRLLCYSLAVCERGSGEARVDLVDHFVPPGRLQVTDDAIHLGLAHPIYHRLQIPPGAEVSRGKRRSELMKPEVAGRHSGSVCISLERTDHMRVWLPTLGAEDECGGCGALCWESFPINFEGFEQFIRDRHFALFVRLRRPVELGLPTHLDNVCSEADVVPGDVHRLLLSEATHQQEVIEHPVV